MGSRVCCFSHDNQDDLESLFYVLLFIATGGRLPWRHVIGSLSNINAMKQGYMTSHFEDVLKHCDSTYVLLVRAFHAALFSNENCNIQDVKRVLQRESGSDTSETVPSISTD